MSRSSESLTLREPNPQRWLTPVFPGVVVAAGLAWLSIWLADTTGTVLMGFDNSPVSAVMVSLLLGMVIGNTLPLPDRLQPGIQFSVKQVLRFGIVLLGIRLSVFDVFQLGIIGLPIVLLCVASALWLTLWLSKRLNLPEKLGVLIAVGTSICGVSAILATAPAIDAEDEDVAYAVGVITVFGLVATLLYPYAADRLFASDATKAGLFLGTAIHDTSQVTGAGLVYAEVFDSPRGLDAATVTKMVRNVLMALVIPIMALRYTHANVRSEHQQVKLSRLLPLFVLGFVGLAIFRSIGDAGIESGQKAFWLWTDDRWVAAHTFIKDWAVNLLVMALAGVGLSIRLSLFRGLGIKPFLAGLGAALIVGAVSICTISILGSFVTF